MTAKKELKKIKSGFLQRGFSIAKLALSTGTDIVNHKLKENFSSEPTDELWKVVLSKNAHKITHELGELKGSLMKAGQLLSMYGEHFLPPEVNQILKKLQSDSPSLEWVAIEKILQTELGSELLSELEIEKKPLAAASMGQVHLAKIKNSGQQIVLKIQYPNVDKAIDNDISALKKFLNLIEILPQDLDLNPVFHEIKLMLEQETRYDLEANLTEEYGNLLKDDTRFIVPKVYRKFCTNKILATSFEPGFRVDSGNISQLNQAERNYIASNYLDLYYKELFNWHLVQTDPHLGNYKIRINPDGKHQIILYDFGATRKYSTEFILPYLSMVKSIQEQNNEEFNKSAKKLKMIFDEDDPQLQKEFKDFCFETVEPFADHEYDWKATNLPERLSKRGFQMVKNHKWRTPPSELLFLDRKTAGVFIFLSALRAKMNSSTQFKSYTNKVVYL